MWDSVPWFIGGGAQHSPEVARLLSYAATSGAQGIVSPSDLKVAPLAVPGGGVRIAPGAALILNRATGGDSQTYVARLPIEDTISIASTGSAVGRSDLIVAQIEDPFMSGEPWQDPEDPTVGPYIFTRVIPNVPAGTTRLQDVPGYAGRSAITLARIDIPPVTGTITAAMITDLRKLAQPRSSRVVWSGSGSSGGDATLTATSGRQTWPNATLDVAIPEWATWVHITMTLAGIIQSGGQVDASLFLQLNAADLGGALRIDHDQIIDGVRNTYIVTGSGTLAAAYPGTTRNVRLQGVNTANRTGRLRADGGSHILFDVQFEERAV